METRMKCIDSREEIEKREEEDKEGNFSLRFF